MASARALHSWTILELLCLKSHIQLPLVSRKLLTARASLLLTPLSLSLNLLRSQELCSGESRGSQEINPIGGVSHPAPKKQVGNQALD